MAVQDDISPLLEEFKTVFAHSGEYGVLGEWPRDTILFYRLIGAENTSWKKICRFRHEHAEEQMMKDVKQLKLQQGVTYTLEMVLNFSPCEECSDRLIQFKNELKSFGKNLRITIRTSSFYKTYERPNMDGLLNLVREKVVLKIFDGDPDWTEFLRDVIDVPEEHFSEWLAVILKDERRAREYIDRCILKDIYSCYREDISKEDLYEMGRNPSNAREIKRRRKERRASSLDPYQLARTAQTDVGRYFWQMY